MKCPIDHELLKHMPVEVKFLADIHLDVCSKCSGVWVDAEVLQKLIAGFSGDYQQTYKKWLIATSDDVT